MLPEVLVEISTILGPV